MARAVFDYPPVGGTQDVFFPRAATAAMPTIASGHGPYLEDAQGRRLLDVCSGPFLAGLGQGNLRVLEAMLAQGRSLTYTYSRTTRHEVNAALSHRLAALAGPGFERVHLTSGGSEAMEMALKLCRVLAVARGQAQRDRIISLMPSFHGSTVFTLGLNGDHAAEALWGAWTTPSVKIPAPLTYRAEHPEAAARATLSALELAVDEWGAHRVLALVVEPIGGQASGVNVPHPSFLPQVRAICDRHGIKLIFDEVVTAFRTGAFLAAHHQPEARPDLVVVAKGLGAGYAPLGATLVSAEVADELAEANGFVVSHSYDASPMACAAGAAVLDVVVQGGLIQKAAVVGTHLKAGLERLQQKWPVIGDVRGRGLLLGIELVADRQTQARFGRHVDPSAILVRHGLDHGLLLYARRQNEGAYGDWLVIAPPLIIDAAVADDLVVRLEATLASAAAELCGA